MFRKTAGTLWITSPGSVASTPIKFGFDIRAIQDNAFGNNRDAGYFDFGALETAFPGTATTGTGYASYPLRCRGCRRGLGVCDSRIIGNRSRYYAFFWPG